MIIAIILAGMLNAVMDVIQIKWNTSVFNEITNKKWVQFMNPLYSWKNKWRDGDKSCGEKFLGSSTFLVFLTDLWHLLKFLVIILSIITVITYTPIYNWYYDLIIYYILFTVPFQLTYTIISK